MSPPSCFTRSSSTAPRASNSRLIMLSIVSGLMRSDSSCARVAWNTFDGEPNASRSFVATRGPTPGVMFREIQSFIFWILGFGFWICDGTTSYRLNRSYCHRKDFIDLIDERHDLLFQDEVRVYKQLNPVQAFIGFLFNDG